jgi:hypothetical protein
MSDYNRRTIEWHGQLNWLQLPRRPIRIADFNRWGSSPPRLRGWILRSRCDRFAIASASERKSVLEVGRIPALVTSFLPIFLEWVRYLPCRGGRPQTRRLSSGAVCKTRPEDRGHSPHFIRPAARLRAISSSSSVSLAVLPQLYVPYSI